MNFIEYLNNDEVVIKDFLDKNEIPYTTEVENGKAKLVFNKRYLMNNELRSLILSLKKNG